jgi:hypothetical protein
MANAAAITLNDLTANGAVAQPTADVLDTGTAAVTLPLALAGKGTGRTIVIVKNTAANALKVELLAGDNPPALRAGLGDLTLVAAAAQNEINVFSAFESSRFIQTDGATKGRLDFKFTPASGTIGVQITAYRLPKGA